jgi:hypothetical protein
MLFAVWLGNAHTKDIARDELAKVQIEQPHLSAADAQALANQRASSIVESKQSRSTEISKLNKLRYEELKARRKIGADTNEVFWCKKYDCDKQKIASLRFETSRAIFSNGSWAWKPGKEIRHPFPSESLVDVLSADLYGAEFK